jgi:hypothetical protein
MHLFDATKREATNRVSAVLAGLAPPKRKRKPKKLKVVAGGKR